MPLWLTAVVTFSSAFLLFVVELLVGKAALPHFGGMPSVWNSCLVFFQAALLGGYLLARWLPTRSVATQVRVYTTLLGSSALWLVAQGLVLGAPLAVPASLDGHSDALHVLLYLTVSVGLPFFTLSATAPLLQNWQAMGGQRAPWWLYAVSNVGAFAALAVYPLVIERYLPLTTQSLAWAALLVGNMLALAFLALRGARQSSTSEQPEPLSSGAVAGWVGLSALGTALLASTTHMLCEDVSSGPLLWALPLSVYLLTFVATFTTERTWVRYVSNACFVVGAVWTAGNFGAVATPLASQIAALLLLQWGSSVMCHGLLYRTRPAVSRLGDFYVAVAVGGALGTLLVALAAPVTFNDFWEYPLVIVLSGLVAMAVGARKPEGMGRALFASRLLFGTVVFLVCLGVWSTFSDRRKDPLFRARSFFGSLRVTEAVVTGSTHTARILVHGNIDHGYQFLDPMLAQTPTSYYGAKTGLGQAVSLLKAREGRPLSVATLGLGIGASIALFGEGDAVDFYEIDPQMVSLAQGLNGYFTFLSQTKATVGIHLGDARFTLTRESARNERDLIVVDVFSGDSIPVHLLTREAFALYFSHLKPNGVLAVHISNLHLRLARVVFGLAQDMGLRTITVAGPVTPTTNANDWAILTRDDALLDALTSEPGGGLRTAQVPTVVWTDERSSILDVMFDAKPAAAPAP